MYYLRRRGIIESKYLHVYLSIELRLLAPADLKGGGRSQFVCGFHQLVQGLMHVKFFCVIRDEFESADLSVFNEVSWKKYYKTFNMTYFCPS
jgi:hypothetical protein